MLVCPVPMFGDRLEGNLDLCWAVTVTHGRGMGVGWASMLDEICRFI